MEKQRNSPDMIDLLVCPGFCVRDRKIISLNDAAGRQFLTVGTDVEELIVKGLEEYREFTEGCLWVQLNLAGKTQGAVVTAMEDFQVFLTDDDRELQELQLLALAAQELRTPLSNIMVSAERIVPDPEDEKSQDHRNRLNRGTAQLLRVLGNMSDALRYQQTCRLETRNITALAEEIFQKAGHLAEQAGFTFRYTGLDQDVYTLADCEQLERAILNILSNAMKFTPQGGIITAEITRRGKLLRLSIADSGSGIAQSVRQNLFTRYLRAPSLEDSRFGLGLGMVLIRAAAVNHGGTVLIDSPGQGTRVTMTLAIRQAQEALLRSPLLHVDYAGERDHGLLELSDCLPAELYHPDL